MNPESRLINLLSTIDMVKQRILLVEVFSIGPNHLNGTCHYYFLEALKYAHNPNLMLVRLLSPKVDHGARDIK